MDADGAVIVTEHRLAQVTEAAARRSQHEQTIRERLVAGELTLDLLALRPEPETPAPTNPRPTPTSAGPWLRSRTPPPNDRGATCRQQLKSPTNG